MTSDVTRHNPISIRCVEEDAYHQNYFTNPPLQPLTFFFSDKMVEKEYHLTAWKANNNLNPDEEHTLASSSFNAHFDILVSGVVFLITCFSCFVQYEAGQVWLVVCFVAAAYHLLVVFVCVMMMLGPGQDRSLFQQLYAWCRKWYPSQVKYSKAGLD